MLQIDSVRSSVKFSIRNFGIEVEGEFAGLRGTIELNADNFEGSVFVVSIPAGSINTGINLRDRHLRDRDYFDAKSFPTIHFESTSVRRGAEPARWLLLGKLNIKRTTKDIVISFGYNNDGERIKFNGSFMLNRQDFDVGKSSLSLSDDVLVEIEAVAPLPPGYKQINRSPQRP